VKEQNTSYRIPIVGAGKELIDPRLTAAPRNESLAHNVSGIESPSLRND